MNYEDKISALQAMSPEDIEALISTCKDERIAYKAALEALVEVDKRAIFDPKNTFVLFNVDRFNSRKIEKMGEQRFNDCIGNGIAR